MNRDVDKADIADVEITDEMLDAGARALYRWSVRDDPARVIVCDVYEAMISARRRELQSQER
jgi:hypothetical protein